MRASKAGNAMGVGRKSVHSHWMWSTVSVLSVLLPLVAASEASAQEGVGLDSPYEAPKQLTESPLGVDLQSGKFSYKTTDISIGPLTFERSFLGGREVYGNAHFGPNWSHNHSIYAYEKDPNKLDGTLVVIGGKTIYFGRSGNGFSWFSPEAEGSFLEGDNGSFVYTDQQGNVYRFTKAVSAVPSDKIQNGSPNQRIARIDYTNGHTITYTYSSMKLTEIASNYGYSIKLSYGPNGYISQACGYNRADTSAGICTSYKYNSPNSTNLSEMVDGLNQKWGYDYASGMQLTCVRQVNASNCRIANSYGGSKPRQVTQQTVADGGVWNYRYDEPDREYDPNAHNGYRETTGGGYTDPEENGVWAEFYSGQLKRYYQGGRNNDPNWNLNQSRVTELTWNGLELEKLTHQEGNSVTYYRRGEILAGEKWTPKPGSDLAPVATSSGFPTREGPYAEYNYCAPSLGRKRCNKPEWKSDFNGNKTHYTYRPEHGGVETETGPAVNGVKPQKRYTYVAKTAGAAPAGPPIWLMSTMSFCRTSNSPPGGGCEKAGDEVVTTYNYELKNLNLSSETVTVDGLSRQTCYSYDWQGNKTSSKVTNGTCS